MPSEASVCWHLFLDLDSTQKCVCLDCRCFSSGASPAYSLRYISSLHSFPLVFFTCSKTQTVSVTVVRNHKFDGCHCFSVSESGYKKSFDCSFHITKPMVVQMIERRKQRRVCGMSRNVLL